LIFSIALRRYNEPWKLDQKKCKNKVVGVQNKPAQQEEPTTMRKRYDLKNSFLRVLKRSLKRQGRKKNSTNWNRSRMSCTSKSASYR